MTQKRSNPQRPHAWCVYIIRASDDRLYTGITTDLEKRWRAHDGGRGGAKFFRGRRPAHLCFVETGHDRSSASRREATIKRMTRRQKLQLIAASATPVPLNGD
ncbi:GIY-YIG nuclease family protein [Exilibacterium tricleocarpae]|uniref:GIY-YIG nuclease family protein n=1 Tax=Exilibacterium tricleocarpae TaxID=2591008 RepID=A0A545TLZ8_9GAMM|nr:GIY-YIG nuclease family protein [Exilibacterium tricleocarpae]TQV78253.1 GIY-YIG nuclease family protein [Exilibacterium tricleocarpae]